MTVEGTTVTTLTNGTSIEPGMILLMAPPWRPWYVRLWRWARRGFKRELPQRVTVTRVDRGRTVLTVEGGSTRTVRM